LENLVLFGYVIHFTNTKYFLLFTFFRNEIVNGKRVIKLHLTEAEKRSSQEKKSQNQSQETEIKQKPTERWDFLYNIFYECK
jgi:hypothetical protein